MIPPRLLQPLLQVAPESLSNESCQTVRFDVRESKSCREERSEQSHRDAIRVYLHDPSLHQSSFVGSLREIGFRGEAVERTFSGLDGNQLFKRTFVARRSGGCAQC